MRSIHAFPGAVLRPSTRGSAVPPPEDGRSAETSQNPDRGGAGSGQEEPHRGFPGARPRRGTPCEGADRAARPTARSASFPPSGLTSRRKPTTLALPCRSTRPPPGPDPSLARPSPVRRRAWHRRLPRAGRSGRRQRSTVLRPGGTPPRRGEGGEGARGGRGAERRLPGAAEADHRQPTPGEGDGWRTGRWVLAVGEGAA